MPLAGSPIQLTHHLVGQEQNALMNLPFVVDGDVVVTQSNAVLMYMGRKFGLVGTNEKEVTCG